MLSIRKVRPSNPETGELGEWSAPADRNSLGTSLQAAQAQQFPHEYVRKHGVDEAEEIGWAAPGVMQAVASQKALDAQRRRTLGGRQSTILTGGRGLMEPAPVSRKQILG